MSKDKQRMTLCVTESCSAQNPPKSVKKLIDTCADVTLEKAIEIATVEEIAVQQLKEMKDETEKEVHAAEKKPARR